MTLLYFAYGSNMLTRRLRARCPSAEPLGPATAADHALRWHKRGTDGSGKASVLPSAGSTVHGVLFRLDPSDLPNLDTAEARGKGYDRLDCFAVDSSLAAQGSVVTYSAMADHVDEALRPYDWYWQLVVAGAREHALPRHWLAQLEATPWIADPQPARRARRHALTLLGG